MKPVPRPALWFTLGVLLLLPSVLAADSWYHVDGFTLVVGDRVVVHASEGDHFVLHPRDGQRVSVDGTVKALSREPFPENALVSFALDQFRRGPAWGSDEPLSSIDLEFAPHNDHWVIRVETESLAAYYYVIPVTGTPGGRVTHIVLAPQRPETNMDDDEARQDLIFVIEDLRIEIEDSAG